MQPETSDNENEIANNSKYAEIEKYIGNNFKVDKEIRCKIVTHDNEGNIVVNDGVNRFVINSDDHELYTLNLFGYKKYLLNNVNLYNNGPSKCITIQDDNKILYLILDNPGNMVEYLKQTLQSSHAVAGKTKRKKRRHRKRTASTRR